MDGRFYKSNFFIIGSFFGVLIFICIIIYFSNWKARLGNNDLLLSYESLEDAKIIEETVDGIVYKDYLLGEKIGRVIVEADGRHITIRDNKNGFIKEYRDYVLYGVHNFKKAELLAELKSYLRPRFWFGGTRVVQVDTKYDVFSRTDEECREIGKLLLEKKYDEIRSNEKNKIIITKSGRYFVN